MKLRQVIINLVNNAIKFTDQGSVQISVRALANQRTIEFSVADTGIGIAEEFLPQVFDKFRQIDGSTTRHYSGAGLGLYLVKSFIELMGGSVSVQSKLGEGTTFTVRVPIGTSASLRKENDLTGENYTQFVSSHAQVEGER
jgi:signal transduction histidine kinase